MANERGIERVWTVEYQEGTGPHKQVGQVLPPGNWEQFDPFLLMAEDWFQRGTFPDHPHRGMETMTYVIEGKLKHEDNHGGSGVLEPGDAQLMTAGSGIVHSEDPLPEETVHSLQLWINLPSGKKSAVPRYQDLKAEAMPVRKEEGAEIRIYSGSSGDVMVDTDNHVPLTYVEVNMEAGAKVTQELPGSFNGFIYILEGSGTFGSGETEGKQNQVLWLGRTSSETSSEVSIHANNSLRAILVAGEPIGEPVVARGPFVMNSEEEIFQAYRDYQQGKFGPSN
ncbi:pirin family protein [Thalassobacillus devorans]|uniref:pirin family protein n=1 Tax=Thalassobacillus devorans TaxID=279813 RepID=UPI00048A94D4|nr:pirin family protein [Thalassobacillus devorans]